jgi:hypothetical protein
LADSDAKHAALHFLRLKNSTFTKNKHTSKQQNRKLLEFYPSFTTIFENCIVKLQIQSDPLGSK